MNYPCFSSTCMAFTDCDWTRQTRTQITIRLQTKTLWQANQIYQTKQEDNLLVCARVKVQHRAIHFESKGMANANLEIHRKYCLPLFD